MDLGLLDGVAELDIVLLGVEDGHEFLAEVDLLGRRGVVLGDDVGVAGDGVDDDRGVVLPRPADLDRLGAVVDDDHLLQVDLALEVLPPLQDIAGHLLAFLHLYYLVTYKC